mmetsp:Transcript_59136/g.183615  ORF Transcript_59136/g.183615 Transcript_59136/m.183615 type:complete len:114 (+) Transcript_59136:76-417(+)
MAEEMMLDAVKLARFMNWIADQMRKEGADIREPGAGHASNVLRGDSCKLDDKGAVHVSGLCPVRGSQPSVVAQSLEWAVMKEMKWDIGSEMSSGDACDAFDAAVKKVGPGFSG